MKTRLIFLLPLLLLFINCSDSDTDSSPLTLSESTFENVDANGATLRIKIESNSTWKVSSDKQWCFPHKEEGDGDGELILSVVANLDGSSRDATVTIMSSKASKKIQINQKTLGITAKNYHYNLPVIFHVFYKNKAEALQYVNSNRFSEILNEVNKLYKDTSKSIDMNLTFSLASIDPEGNELTTPGVEYIEWPEGYPINCKTFMNDEKQGYVNYLWEPNLYINVMVYNFKQEGNSIILGISNLPLTTNGEAYLEGLNTSNYSFLRKKNLVNPYCVSINSLYINDKGTDGINATVAHELGHYLGLHHVFNENKRTGDIVDNCIDSDYCEDTPPYNKVKYNEWLAENYGSSSFATLALRVDCNTEEEFTSYNIMDYSYSYLNQFTPDQFARVRHVLMYSPLIPGPKVGQSTKARSAGDGPVDLPIRIVE